MVVQSLRSIGVVVGIIPEQGPARNPTARQAGARIALASIIQLSGTFFVMLPLWLEMGEKGWQHDCFKVGSWFGGLGSAVLVGALIYVILSKDAINVVATEWIIKILYTTNIVALSLAMVRVGGPSSSVFGHLIPLQLSGILLLEQQKDSMITPSRYAAFRYSAVALLIWITAAALRDRIVQWPFWTGDVQPCTSGCNDELATKLLIPFELFFTVLVYYLLRSKRFWKIFGAKKRRTDSVKSSARVAE
jgi:hypothetical protein